MSYSTRRPSGLFLPLIVAYEAVIMLAYALKLSQYRPLLFIPVSLILCNIVLLSRSCAITAVPPVDFLLGATLLTQAFTAFDGIVLTDVQKTLCRIGETPGHVTSTSFAKRLAWALDLNFSPRGVGWAHEVPGLPKRPDSTLRSKRSFLLSQTYALLKTAIMAVILRAASDLEPMMWYGATPAWDEPLYFRVMASIAAPVVGVGISQPSEWRPLFGPLDASYTVRNYWSVTWHQILRKPLAKISDHILRKFFPRSAVRPTLAYRFIQLHLIFFLSGLIHLGAEFIVRGEGGINFLVFFILQPWIITLEEIIQYLVTGTASSRNRRPKLIWRLVGYVWVFCWCVALMPLSQGFINGRGLHYGVDFWVRKGGPSVSQRTEYPGSGLELSKVEA
ncbi:hypothetical protein NP233_g8663 [Leucocoprinus birnbaumii]|uniref:Wax synthase domain-containing protein n=1 Tax=Leucocoprinus birnbaumii TaxID=56174 RepID=A0AAD5YNV5_9AGAR|nr:hypothetical protein NP233_g8663 [Leucocoprinus birnbaumii]